MLGQRFFDVFSGFISANTSPRTLTLLAVVVLWLAVQTAVLVKGEADASRRRADPPGQELT